MRPYVVSVLPRRGRWRADLPGAFAILFAIAWVTGVTSSEIRTELGAFVWGSLAAALALFWLARRGWYSLRWVLTVDDRGVTLANKTSTIELGVPKSIAHGCYRMMLSAGKVHRSTPHLWIAVTSNDDRTIVFQRAMGLADHVPTDWPDAMPPASREIFSSVSFDPVFFYERITRC
ncbi:MAG TPA: hypothetical protein VL463_36850 [Kofleriaceae bacterium]|nr:hypothetical protein [Kofleriaceae bacterium]